MLPCSQIFIPSIAIAEVVNRRFIARRDGTDRSLWRHKKFKIELKE